MPFRSEIKGFQPADVAHGVRIDDRTVHVVVRAGFGIGLPFQHVSGGISRTIRTYYIIIIIHLAYKIAVIIEQRWSIAVSIAPVSPVIIYPALNIQIYLICITIIKGMTAICISFLYIIIPGINLIRRCKQQAQEQTHGGQQYFCK